MRQIIILLGGAVALMITGCASQSNRAQTAVPLSYPVPAQWATGDGAPVEPRLRSLGGAQLQALIAKGYERNFNLQQAAARVKQAQLQTTIVGAANNPTLSGAIDGSRSERRRGLVDGVSATESEDYGLSLSAAWELDLWGKLASRRSASQANLEAAQADYDAARLSLAGQIAKGWFNVLEATMQVQIAQDALASFENDQALMRDRFQRGMNTALDLQLSEANVSTAKSALVQRRAQHDQLVRSLEVLIGVYPDASLESEARLPALPGPVPAGLPSSLLKRRPDVQAADKRILAARYSQDEKEKDRWPSIRLTGRAGTSSEELKNIADWDFRFSNIAAGLTQPIFEAGRRKAQAASAEVNTELAALNYQQTALQAFQEVEQALANEGFLTERVDALSKTVADYQAAEELARENYGQGLTDILTVLDSQRRYYQNQQLLVQAQNQQLQNRVNLIISLGGDPKIPPATTTLTLPLRTMKR